MLILHIYISIFFFVAFIQGLEATVASLSRLREDDIAILILIKKPDVKEDSNVLRFSLVIFFSDKPWTKPSWV